VPTQRKGFTLIELLIVVVIIGILASIAIPKYGQTKAQAYVTTMKADLRNLATAEETYFVDHREYFEGTATNDGLGGTSSVGDGWVPSSGVTVQATLSGAGWYAKAVYVSGTTRTCALYVGVPPQAPATAEGSAQCDP
jgi:prepilin-type N-terminal cleavage/methylation domain-containing protein